MVLPLDVFLWCVREVLALREKLPQKPIGILVGPALPWMVRSRKVDVERLRSQRVVRHRLVRRSRIAAKLTRYGRLAPV